LTGNASSSAHQQDRADVLPRDKRTTLVHCTVGQGTLGRSLLVRSNASSDPVRWCTPADVSTATGTLADLPWADYRVRLQLRVRKWFCRNRSCRRRIFTERLPAVAAPWARRTLRLASVSWTSYGLRRQGWGRLSQRWGLAVSRNTLLRLLHRQPAPSFPTPTVLGVDDFALRKRHTSGTSWWTWSAASP